MSGPNGKPFWRFDRDVMNRISNERVGRGQPEADAASPVRHMAGGGPGSRSVDRTGSTGAARLRAAIDRGGTGDKVDYPDPAAAPLGTDEEAAGTPLKAEHVAIALAAEVARPGTASHERHRSRHIPGLAVWAIAIAAACALFVAVLAVATP